MKSLRNPILDRRPNVALRDPALLYRDGRLWCFHTAVEKPGDQFRLYVDVVISDDMIRWTSPRRLTDSPLSFSSPGNIIRRGDEWILCVQSYPVPPGEEYGSEDSRLWLMRSADLIHWGEPRMIAPQGSRARWSGSRRQIDPYVVEHDGKFWCLYKSSGCLGLLVSDDLGEWSEAAMDRPILGPQDTPDGRLVENPCVVPADDGFVLFFSPCGKGRGIGVARSDDLLQWRDVHYLDFPALPWAPGGPWWCTARTGWMRFPCLVKPG